MHRANRDKKQNLRPTPAFWGTRVRKRIRTEYEGESEDASGVYQFSAPQCSATNWSSCGILLKLKLKQLHVRSQVKNKPYLAAPIEFSCATDHRSDVCSQNIKINRSTLMYI